jgi:ATP-dependent Clp protease protease subunit
MKLKLNMDPKIKLGNDGQLDVPHVVSLRGEITEEVLNDFSNSFNVAQNTGQDVIPIIIDSYGGDIYAMLAISDIISTATVPVATIVCGKAMSAGAFIFSCGTEGYRFISPHSTVMIHQASTMLGGNTDEIQVEAAEVVRLNKKAIEQMALNCQHPKNYFEKLLQKNNNINLYLDSKEAKRHNLANHIRMPEYHVDVTVNTTFK